MFDMSLFMERLIGMNATTRLSLFGLCVIFALFFGFVSIGCGGKSGVGEHCKSSSDCEEGLFCRNNRCLKSVSNNKDGGEEPAPSEPTTTPEEATTSADAATPEEATGQEPTTPDTATPEPSPEPTPPEPSGGEQNTTEPQPTETTTQDQTTPGTLTVYDINDANSPQHPQEGATVTIENVVMTTPAVRLTSTLNTFFVQATQMRQNSFKYSGIQIVYDRNTLQVNFPVGTKLQLTGKYAVFRFVSWKSSCTTDADCASEQTAKTCKQVFDKNTSQNVMRCTDYGMPQLELSAAPKSTGNATPPTPIVVEPGDVNTHNPLSEAYRGVLLKVENVHVTSANPDAAAGKQTPDYGEFGIANSTNAASLRVDDLINSTTYTGSKYCNCSNGGDNSYCLPGDTCQCSGNTGTCHTGSASPDQRNAGDEFEYIIGVLHYAFSNYKLVPRLATDLKRKP